MREKKLVIALIHAGQRALAGFCRKRVTLLTSIR
jgi:hypothetical protein